jgi:hypothetical protein
MFAKELLEKRFGIDGITYGANDLTKPFLDYLASTYANELRLRSRWLKDGFEYLSDQELHNYMSSNIGMWGAEFKLESVVRGLPL